MDPYKKKSSNKKSKGNGYTGNQDQMILEKSEIKNEEKWIKSHSVSYTFNKDEFLPNPDSKLWQ